ncbi:hypothetical protein D3C81_2288080 [compost metagenome]
MVGGALQRIVSRLAKQIGQHRVITAAVATFAQREVGLPGRSEHRENGNITAFQAAFVLPRPACIDV